MAAAAAAATVVVVIIALVVYAIAGVLDDRIRVLDNLSIEKP